MAKLQLIAKEFILDKQYSTFENFMKKTEERKLLKQKAQLKDFSNKTKKEAKRNSLLDSSITQFQSWWRHLQHKVVDQRKELKDWDIQNSRNKLLSLERTEQKKIEMKQIQKARNDQVRALTSLHCKRKSNLPLVHYRSKIRKKRPSQLNLPPPTDFANNSVGGEDVFSLTDIQGKPLSAATRMLSPTSPQKRLFSPQMKSSGLEYPSIRSTGPESIMSKNSRQIKSQDAQNKLSGDVFQISLETEGEEVKRNLIELRRISQRANHFSSTTVGSKISKSHDEPQVAKFGEERTKHLKPDFHQAINLDIQFLRAKFRNYQRDLFKNTSHKLSPDNKLNFKKVLNKIRDMSEMSYERQKEQVKMRRKFRYPFLKHEEDAHKTMPLHFDHKHENKEKEAH